MATTAELLYHYSKNPINAIESLFKVTLDSQQRALVLSACEVDARVAVKSCQGAGKTATLVWLAIYFLLTRDDCRILITAPSSNQLQRVFHSELLKWKSKMPQVFQDFFDIRKEAFNIVDVEFQLASLVTGSPSNIESLQGGHAKHYIILADEASGLAEEVFDTLFGTLGASEDGKMILTSNPVRNSGRFFEIFSQDEKETIWKRLTFDAFTSKQIKPSWIEGMKSQYGEEDDNYKIRVLGEFGSLGTAQFFPRKIVNEARVTTLDKYEYHNFERVGGLDVARFGDDSTVFCTRQGPKIVDITEYKGLDTQEVAFKAQDYIRRQKLSVLNVDGIGVGAGVVDRLREFGSPVKDVIVSAKSTEPLMYANLRAQLYGYMKEWLMNGADIPYEDKDLMHQLNAITYSYNPKMQLLITGKKDIKKLLGYSTDIVDSISLTFASGIYGYTAKTKARRVIKRDIRI